jgi:hypothetical protein
MQRQTFDKTPGLQVSPEVTRMIDMIEDGDLWRWKLPGSDAFYAGLGALELEYDAAAHPSIFATLLGLDPDDLIQKVRGGSPVYRGHDSEPLVLTG